MSEIIIETKPPEFHKKYALVGRYSNNAANALVNAASNFGNTFGILPSIRCANLASDLEKVSAEMGENPTLLQANRVRCKWAPLLVKKYGLKEGLVKQLDKNSAGIAVKILLETIAPAYERCENDFTDKLRRGCKRLGANYASFISESIGNPFVKLTFYEPDVIGVMPTSRELLKTYERNRTRFQHPGSIAFLKLEVTERKEMVVTSLQRDRLKGKSIDEFYDNLQKVSLEDFVFAHIDRAYGRLSIGEEFDKGLTAGRAGDKQPKSGKQPFAPYSLLEELFLLTVAFTKCKKIFIIDSKTIFRDWQAVFRFFSDGFKGDLSRLDFGIYDELGKKYGKHAEMIPETKFVKQLGFEATGWIIDLR